MRPVKLAGCKSKGIVSMRSFFLNGAKLIFVYLLSCSYAFSVAETVEIEKALLYDQYTLSDTYAYKKTTRQFQWDKVRGFLALIDHMQLKPAIWGVLQNYKNRNGLPPLTRDSHTDEYGRVADAFNVEQHQSIPLYTVNDKEVPARYVVDGAWVKIMDDSNVSTDENAFVKVVVVGLSYKDEWMVPRRYIHFIDTAVVFKKVIFVDRINQNITTLENIGSKWLVRSMNPATTGLHRPPYQMPTPVGIFVVQDKKATMAYYKDGTEDVGGHAPYASRFSSGGYIHGIPVDLPQTGTIEFSATLGTTPLSHKCVRNATSHALFIYGWAPIDQALVVVFD